LPSQGQQPRPRGDDRERTTRARQAAEALFTSKPPISTPTVPADAPADPAARKPRVLQMISPPALVGLEAAASPIGPKQRIMSEIPRSQFARIRTWVKYGMTLAQVAEVYGVPVGEIENILRKA